MNDDFFFDWSEINREAREHQKHMEEVVNRLRADPCMQIPEVGDTVIVAAGPLGMGHAWTRVEAEVQQVATNSYQVLFRDQYGPCKEASEWIDPVLVVDKEVAAVMQQKIGELQALLAHRDSQLTQMSKDRERWVDQWDAAQKELSELQQQLASKDAEIQRLKTENSTRWETEQALRKALARRSLPVAGRVVDGGRVEWTGEQP